MEIYFVSLGKKAIAGRTKPTNVKNQKTDQNFTLLARNLLIKKRYLRSKDKKCI